MELDRYSIPDTPPAGNNDTRGAAWGIIRAYARWHICPIITETLTLDATGTRTINLPTLRLLEVERLEYAGQEIAPENIEFSDAGLIRVGKTSLPSRLGGIKATIRHGYDPKECVEIFQIVRALADRMQTGNASQGIVQQTTGPFSMRFGTLTGGMPLSQALLLEPEKQVLARYRLPLGPGW